MQSVLIACQKNKLAHVEMSLSFSPSLTLSLSADSISNPSISAVSSHFTNYDFPKLVEFVTSDEELLLNFSLALAKSGTMFPKKKSTETMVLLSFNHHFSFFFSSSCSLIVFRQYGNLIIHQQEDMWHYNHKPTRLWKQLFRPNKLKLHSLLIDLLT